jgi:hypothetical protein
MSDGESLQAVGILTVTASVVAVPVLGAAGFAATGPVTGSAAAAWQSSIGLAAIYPLSPQR